LIDHPYISMPEYAYWKQSISEKPYGSVDPVVSSKFQFSKTDKIATAGSCFAQHIARYLQSNGYNYFVTETIHPLASRDVRLSSHYGEFSARYGNIYTSRQLLQLFDRAYGEFKPKEDTWELENGRFVDPFRPRVEPNGFVSMAELHEDREKHFKAVRKASEELDVFVFTLGLTECWSSRDDGATYPLCPGVAGGKFDPREHLFTNLSADNVSSEMISFIGKLRSINPTSKVLLTVSPVPLVATAVDRHVLVSTTYSKSVLRVAAETIVDQFEGVDYFPSFEIITGDYARGRYFAQDSKTVQKNGVEHVMRLLMKYYALDAGNSESSQPESDDSKHQKHIEEMESYIRVNCDEEELGNPNASSPFTQSSI